MAKKQRHKLKKLIIRSLLIVLLLISAGILFLSSQKDKLVPYLINTLNKQINGEINIEEASLSILKHFPELSISLARPTLSMDKEHHNDTLMLFERVDVSFDVMALLRSKIDIEKLYVYEGEIRMIQNEDSSYTLLQAFENINSDKKNSADQSDLNLTIEKLYAENIQLNVHQLYDNTSLIEHIKKLDASIEYHQDSLRCELDLNSTLVSFSMKNSTLISDQELNLKGALNVNLNSHLITIINSHMTLGEASFDLDGYYTGDQDKEINLNFGADDKDLKFTKLFFASNTDSIIDSGNLYLKGGIKGSLNDELPMIHVSFGAENLSLSIPKTNDQIKNLDFDGHFYSGEKRDLSQALLKIDSISALLPDGYLNGHFNIRSFKDPYLSYHLKCKAKLDGIDKLLAKSTIDSIGGVISIDSHFKGYLHLKENAAKDSINDIKMDLSDLCFRVNKSFVFENIQSHISTKEGQLTFDSTQLSLNNTQLAAKGSISNYYGFFISSKSPTIATVELTTPLFDFPMFFSYDTAIANSFPYQIENTRAEVVMTTSKDELSKFTFLPSIAFEIKNLSGSAPKLCAGINIKKGNFQLGQSTSEATLNFQDFDLSIGDDPIQLNLFYSWAQNKDDSLLIDANFHQFDAVENINLAFLDSFKDSSHIILDGPFSAELQWRSDSTTTYKRIEIAIAKLRYAKEDSIISAQNVQISAKNINGITKEKYPLSTMNGVFDFRFGEIHTSIYEDKNIHFAIDIDRGHFLLDANYDAEPYKNMSLNIDSRPFDSIPNYKIKHSIKGTSVNKLFPGKNKSIVFGDVDFELDIEFNGNSTKDFLASLEGQLLFKGDSMLIQGYNIDRLISNFKRSQNFNLVDLGAVAVAGPVGLLYSKGSDYARMFVGNNKDSSIIDEFYSEWRVKNGFFVVKDFAFSTDENRIAFDGWINLNRDSLDLQIALIDSLGCSIITQGLSGNLSHPKAGKVKFVKTALAPITNLVNDILDVNCDVFYDGVVKPTPQKKKKI